MNNHYAEVVSPMHPDKIADRIAGSLVDYCYSVTDNPRCAFEVMIGHGHCDIIGESSVDVPFSVADDIVLMITDDPHVAVSLRIYKQDANLAKAQAGTPVAGDNGIFYGHYFRQTSLHRNLKSMVGLLYDCYPYDGKVVSDGKSCTVCWSKIDSSDELVVRNINKIFRAPVGINPIGDWTGGVDVDTGLTGRKLANDFYGIEAPLGGGNMHGKDLTKADVTMNIMCYLAAQELQEDVVASVSIGDDTYTIVPVRDNRMGKKVSVSDTYVNAMSTARDYIDKLGGFEKLVEWGLV